MAEAAAIRAPEQQAVARCAVAQFPGRAILRIEQENLIPLAATLIPYGRMPLQIFEQRYLDLVRHSLKHDEPFGVVWIRRGSEVAQRASGMGPRIGW